MKKDSIMKKIMLLLSLVITNVSLAAEIKVDQDIGKTTYDSACQVCHNPKVSQGLEAPAAFNQQAWSPIIARAEALAKQDPKFDTGMDYLVYQVRIGKGLMHHGGLCLEANQSSEACTDEAYKAAIQYMSQAKP